MGASSDGAILRLSRFVAAVAVAYIAVVEVRGGTLALQQQDNLVPEEPALAEMSEQEGPRLVQSVEGMADIVHLPPVVSCFDTDEIGVSRGDVRWAKGGQTKLPRSWEAWVGRPFEIATDFCHVKVFRVVSREVSLWAGSKLASFLVMVPLFSGL